MPHPPNDDLRVSAEGLSLIMRFEGFQADWYPDPVGVRTIAYGWTGALPVGFEPPLTESQGRELLRRTVGAYEQAVRDLVTVPLAQGAFDALVSFTYNLGRGSLASSTLLRKLNAGEPGVGAEFDRWVFAGGERLEGLVRRRAVERAMFEAASPPQQVHKPPRPPRPLPPVTPPPMPQHPPPRESEGHTQPPRWPGGRPPDPSRMPSPAPAPRTGPPRRRFWWLRAW